MTCPSCKRKFYPLHLVYEFNSDTSKPITHILIRTMCPFCEIMTENKTKVEWCQNDRVS